jgi:hypothetical protein
LVTARHKTAVFLALFLLALAAVQQDARAADVNDPRLDAVASSVAGHDVHVWCEDDYGKWEVAALGYTYDPAYTHTVWIHPWVCRTLEDQLNGGVYPDDSMGFPKGTPVIMMALAESVHTLVHESVHQIGGQYSDCTVADKSCEGRTDCKALTLDEEVVTRYFGVPATVQQQTTKWVTHRTKVHGRWRATHVMVQILTTVRNPDLDVFKAYIWQFHRSLPPQYRDGC